MEFFTNKKFLFKLIASLCICLTIINFTCIPKAEAASLISDLGGALLDPMVDLLLVLGDGAMEIIQTSIMDAGTGLIFDNAKDKWADGLKFVLKAVLAVALGLVITAAAAALVACIPVAGGILAAGLTSGLVQGAAILVAYSAIPIDWLPDKIYLPTLLYGPEEIFGGKILLFDPNIFAPKDLQVHLVNEDDISGGDEKEMSAKEYQEKLSNADQMDEVRDYVVKDYFYESNGEEIKTSVNNSAYELKSVISKWYYTTRNISLLALMVILVYVGIKILMSTTASEKAKYKQFLWDWLVAMCLIFVMHYYMVFLNVFNENIVDLLSKSVDGGGYVAFIGGPPNKLVEELKDQGMQDVLDDDNNIVWPTNLMGKIRVEAQNQNGTSSYVGYAICYVVLVTYTISFTFVYIKRLLYLLFLTVMSPLVAMTYPIDKIKDGQAQAFNMWSKEYIYNLLIQPFHLLLYTIFVSMAFDLAGKNMIYSLVVIGFMLPAEKFLRNMFGFNKASTPGFLSGAAGTAMTLTGMRSLANFAKGGKNTAKTGDNGKIQEVGQNFLNRKADDDKKSLYSLVGETGIAEGMNVVREAQNVDNNGNGNQQALPNLVDDDTQGNPMTDTVRPGALDGNPDGLPEEDSEQTSEGENQVNDVLGLGQQVVRQQTGQQSIPRQQAGQQSVPRQQVGQQQIPRQQVIRQVDSQQQNPQSQTGQPQIRQQQNQQQQTQQQRNLRDENNLPTNRLTGDEEMPDVGLDKNGNLFRNVKNAIDRDGILNAGRKEAAARLHNFRRDKMNKQTVIKGFASGAKNAVKLTTGGAFGLAGIAAGIATGNPDNVLKYGVSAGYSGMAVGEGTANRVESTIENGIKDYKQKSRENRYETRRTKYGEAEADRLEKEELDKLFLKDREMRKLYAREFGITYNKKNQSKIDEVMGQAIHYRQHGITDNDYIIKGLKLNPNNKATKNNIAAVKIATAAKDERTLQDGLKRYGKLDGISPQQVRLMEDRVRKITGILR